MSLLWNAQVTRELSFMNIAWEEFTILLNIEKHIQGHREQKKVQNSVTLDTGLGRLRSAESRSARDGPGSCSWHDGCIAISDHITSFVLTGSVCLHFHQPAPRCLCQREAVNTWAFLPLPTNQAQTNQSTWVRQFRDVTALSPELPCKAEPK